MSTEKINHTPTPWQTFNGYVVVNANGNTIADCGTTRSIPGMDADAAHIVKCVNSHAALVEALKCLIEFADADDNLDRLEEAIDMSRKALALAESGA